MSTRCARNWKLLVENSIDGYHGMPVHVTYFEDQIARLKKGGLTELPVLGAGGHGIDLGNGHAVIQYPSVQTRASGLWMPECPPELKPTIEGRRALLVERFGEEYAKEIAETSRNLLIFPNLIVIDAMAITIRTFFPVTPDYQEITAWESARQMSRQISMHGGSTRFSAFLVRAVWQPPTTWRFSILSSAGSGRTERCHGRTCPAG